MIKDLWITDITDEDKLREVLEILGDDTWNDRHIVNFCSSEIFYDKKSKEYLTGVPWQEGGAFLTKLTYQEFINKYSDKNLNKLTQDIKHKPLTQYAVKAILPCYESTSERTLTITSKEDAENYIKLCNKGLEYFLNRYDKYLDRHRMACTREWEVVEYLERIRKVLIKQPKYSFLKNVSLNTDFLPYFEIQEIDCYSWNNDLENVLKGFEK